jgi:YidC/Oxa1 family membrane protein insertase
MVFLGVDLTAPSVAFALAAGLAQFIQARSLVQQAPKSTTPKTKGEPDFQASMNMSMMYVLPVMVAGFGLTLPAGLSLYWVVSSLFSFGQQYIIQRRMKKLETSKVSKEN